MRFILIPFYRSHSADVFTVKVANTFAIATSFVRKNIYLSVYSCRIFGSLFICNCCDIINLSKVSYKTSFLNWKKTSTFASHRIASHTRELTDFVWINRLVKSRKTKKYDADFIDKMKTVLGLSICVVLQLTLLNGRAFGQTSHIEMGLKNQYPVFYNRTIEIKPPQIPWYNRWFSRSSSPIQNVTYTFPPNQVS